MDILKITNSKTREKLLAFFFTDVNRRCYLRELERALNLPVGNIRRELLSLEKIGIFDSEKIGNLSFYFLNKKHPLFKELKQIIFKTIGIKGKLKQSLEKIKGIEKAFIFGSFAHAKEDSFSDIDLMIIGQPNDDALADEISLLERQLGREINYLTMTSKEFNQKRKKDNHFLINVIKTKKIFLIGNKL